MKKELKPVKVYENQEGKRVYDVVVEDQKIEGIPAAINIQKSNCRQCKFYQYGKCAPNDDIVVRIFDCQRNVQILQSIYNLITSIIVVIVMYNIFTILQFGLLSELASAIVAFVALDVIFTLIEEVVLKLYEWTYRRKLKNFKAKTEKHLKAVRKTEQKLKKKEEAERLAADPIYQKVLTATTIVQRLKKLSQKYNYGPNEDKVNTCVKKCETILRKLDEDTSQYIRVIYLFEQYLPEFCATLELYGNFIKADVVSKNHEENLTECVDAILKYLESRRVKAMFDTESTEIQFNASTATLKDMLQREIDNEEENP